MKRGCISAALCALVLGGCTERRPLAERVGSFRVEMAQSVGTRAAPLPFPISTVTVDLTITALSNKGGPLTGVNGDVSVFSAPGLVRTAGGKRTVVVPLVDGVGTASITVERVYGRTHVCVEDNLRGDDSTYAAACSPTMWFEMPSVQQIQTTTDSTTSPLINSFLEIRTGDMIVTGIFAEGFYLTDLAEPLPDWPNDPNALPGHFGHLFVYSFSYPEGIVIGDRLSSIIGTVQEFTGSTQLVFPSWTRRDVKTARDDLPVPVVLDEAICQAPTQGTTIGLCGHSSDNLHIESLEGGVVTALDVRTPTRFEDCDYNLDGDVPNYNPACGSPDEPKVCAEIDCKTECNQDLECTELSSLRTYGQWTGAMNSGAGPKINLLTREGFPDFDPLKPENQGLLLDVTGNLRHSLPARPRWVIVARFADDVTIHPTP